MEINFPYKKVFAQIIHYPLTLLLVDVASQNGQIVADLSV